MQLIDKSALIAEVEKKTRGEKGYSSEDAEAGYKDCAIEILSFLEHLEVKEPELEKEISDWWSTHYNNKDYTFEGYTGHYIENSTLLEIAKHFYELGLKEKGES